MELVDSNWQFQRQGHDCRPQHLWPPSSRHRRQRQFQEFQVNDDSILSVGLFIEKGGDEEVEEAAETGSEEDEELILEENE